MSIDQIEKEAESNIEKMALDRQKELKVGQFEEKKEEKSDDKEVKTSQEEKKDGETKGAPEDKESKEEKTEGNVDDKKVDDKKEDKVEKRKEELQSEIDRLVSEKKRLQHEVGKTEELNREIKDLKERLGKIEEPKKVEDVQVRLSSLERERIEKYIAEDIRKPREERREMSKEELDDWYLEDPTSVQEWIGQRALRRYDERNLDRREIDVTQKTQRFVEEQNRSKKKLNDSFPELKKAYQRGEELSSQGLDESEVLETIAKENPQFKMMLEIIEEDRDKYLMRANSPELVLNEMKKRIGKDTVKKEKTTFTKEEVDQMLEEALNEKKKRDDSVDVGETSTLRNNSQSSNNSNPTYKRQLEIVNSLKRKGYTKEMFDKTLERRKNIPGANSLEKGDRR